ncbi:hypothetical protein ACIA5G_41940 [Amycolatopsis sp. NPDC051758]|uniref:hypothetical protein n=1 Tax=Amycolatopsis sp. NPDC051758 TaxID=3363935 RepID=UPI00379E5FDA
MTMRTAPQGTVFERGLVGDVEDFGGFAPDLARGALSAAAAPATAGDEGVGGDQLLRYGVGEQEREAFDDAVDRGFRESGGAEFLFPGADAEVGEFGEGGVAPVGEDVDFEEAAVVLFGALVDVEGVEPGGGELGDGGAAVFGVDPGAGSLLVEHRADVVVGGGGVGEAGDGAFGAVGAAVADSPGVVAGGFGPGHGELLRCGERVAWWCVSRAAP